MPLPSDAYMGERIRVRGITAPGALLLFVAFAIVGLLLYFAQFSGAVRWLVALILVAALAGVGWDQVSRRTRPLAPLAAPLGNGPSRDGELAAVAAAVRRADGGLVYSQVEVASRARTVFLERVRLSRSLTPDRMRDVQRDRAALDRLIGDPDLAAFLHLRTQDMDERYAWVLDAQDGGGFRARFRDILARMEAWR